MDEQTQDLLSERELLRSSNDEELAKLKRERVNIDPLVFLALRLDAIVEMTFGCGDETARVAYDVAYQHKLADSITTWREQAVRAKLTAPGDTQAHYRHG